MPTTSDVLRSSDLSRRFAKAHPSVCEAVIEAPGERPAGSTPRLLVLDRYLAIKHDTFTSLPTLCSQSCQVWEGDVGKAES